jgi:two-component sensor histidine kinase
VYALLDLGYTYFYRHTPDFQNLEKASGYAMLAERLSRSINYKKGIAESYLLLAMVKQEDNDYKQGRMYATKAVDAFKPLNEPDLLGEAWVMLWSTNTLLEAGYQTRVELLNRAAKAFNLSGNKIREADCLKELGDINQIEGDYANAIIVLNKSLALYQDAGFKGLQYIYDLLGRVYMLIGSFDKGVAYIVKAEDVAEEMGDRSCSLNNSIALAYSKVNEPEKALPYSKKALELVEDNNAEQVGIVLTTYVNILTRLDRTADAITLLNKTALRHPEIKNQKNPKLESMMANIYIARKDWDKAAFYCEAIERNIKKFGPELNKDDIFGFISSVISYNIAAGNYNKASYYNAKYDSLCNLRKRVFCNAYDLWEFKIDSAAGNYLSAIRHFQHFKDVNDDILNEVKTKQVNQLIILHDSEKKDKNIQFLQQRAVVQQSQLKSANFIRNTSLAGFLLLMIFIFFMYKNYMEKQKTNIALSSQKEEIKLKNEALQQLVTEKEWLLREIHHRVKNNLHMVVGLLASQGEYLKSKEAVEAMGESQRRVEAMSIIHQKLYQSESLSMIDMPSYIYELTENLASSFELGNKIRFQLNICKAEFPLSHSVPIGLIVNEAVTNAIKYAFPFGRDGIIEIILNEQGNNNFILKISDNGIGIGTDFSIKDCPSLGLRLIDGLSGDMQGDFKIKNNNGTEIELRFTIHDDMVGHLKII